MLRVLLHESRAAWRGLMRSPGFTATAVAMLSVGLGLAMYMFGAVQSFALRPAPFPNGSKLVHVEYVDARDPGDQLEVPHPDFLSMARELRSFEALEGYTQGTVNLGGEEGRPERYNGAFVSEGTFAALGVSPQLGTGFRPGDTAPGAAAVVVISHDIWQNRFGGDEGVLGKVVRVNGRDATVVGVMPPQFAFPTVQDIWVPLEQRPGTARRDNRSLEVFGLLAAGVSMDRAAAEAQALLARLEADDPRPDLATGVLVKPLRDEYYGPETKRAIGTLFAAVILVLLISCANVANLMVSRSARRARETAIRSAVGAGRTRLVVAGLAEAVAICLVAAVIGFVLAQLGGAATMDAIRSSEDPPPYWMAEFRIDGLSVLFAFGIAFAAAVASGLWPAWRAASVADAGGMRDGGAGTTRGMRLGARLTVVEIALCVVLLVCAGLTVRSVIARYTVDMPFQSQGVLTGRIGLFEGDYPADADLVAFAEGLERELQAIPGAEGASVSSSVPFSLVGFNSVEVAGREAAADGRLPFTAVVSAQPGYLDLLEIPLLRGRALSDGDDADAPRVALVSSLAAERLWPGADPVGQRFRLGSADDPDRPWVTVVGVVPHVPQLGEDLQASSVYLPFAQAPTRFLSFLVRVPGAEASFADAARDAVLRVDPDLPVYWLRPLSQWIDASAFDHRLMATLFGMFGAFAVLLAAGGLYAVLAFQVSQRTREFGVRRALGAQPVGIVRLVMGQGLRQLFVGLAIGLVLALGFARLLAGFLFEVSSWDPATFLLAGLVMMLVTMISGLLPTRHALSVAPMQALRHD